MSIRRIVLVVSAVAALLAVANEMTWVGTSNQAVLDQEARAALAHYCTSACDIAALFQHAR